jgi:hypothetical protein
MARALRVTATRHGWSQRFHGAFREDSSTDDVDAYDLRKRTGMTDLARLAAGHVGAQFWCRSTRPASQPTPSTVEGSVASMPGYARVQLEQFDIAKRGSPKYRARMDADRVAGQRRRWPGKIASLLGRGGRDRTRCRHCVFTMNWARAI